MKHDPTIRTPPKRAASRRSIRSPQRTDRVLLKPSDFTAIAHRLQKSVFDDRRPRNVNYARNSGYSFCVVPWRIEHPRESGARPQIILAQVQARNINSDALESRYYLALRLSMDFAERQQRHNA